MTETDAGQFAMLHHAYGRATDTPRHLAALAGDDATARDEALSHLWSAIIHQGTPWTATPPAAIAVAALVGDPRLGGAAHAELRANLLTFLAAVGQAALAHSDLGELAPPEGFDVEAALAAALSSDDELEIFGDEILGNVVYARAIQGCRDVCPTLLGTATDALADPDPRVRAAAAHAVGACAAPAGAPPLAERLDALAAAAGPTERAALVLAMGELGLHPRKHLHDPHPGVRACAALAPTLAADPAATAEILAALADPAATDRWFTQRPPQIRGHIRFTLIAAAVARVDEPLQLLPAALAIAPIAGSYPGDWGPLLHALFSGRTGETLSPAQRRYLRALVDNEKIWDPRNGTIGLVFRDAGLPHDREACRRLAAETAHPARADGAQP